MSKTSSNQKHPFHMHFKNTTQCLKSYLGFSQQCEKKNPWRLFGNLLLQWNVSRRPSFSLMVKKKVWREEWWDQQRSQKLKLEEPLKVKRWNFIFKSSKETEMRADGQVRSCCQERNDKRNKPQQCMQTRQRLTYCCAEHWENIPCVKHVHVSSSVQILIL